jgi:ketosteroid isomerase-like protein
MVRSVTGTPDSSIHQLASAFYEAFLNDDLLGASAFLSSEVVLHVPGDHPLSGDYFGLDGVLKWAVDSLEIMGPGSQHIELVDLMSGDAYAAAYCRVTADRPGRPPLRNTTVHLLRVSEGSIVELWLHDYDVLSVNQFWS